MTKAVKIFMYFTIAGTLASALLFYSKAQAASSAQITATVAVGVCGNNVVEYGEDCDGSALDGRTCSSLGYDGGTLSCNPGCDFNLSECVNLEPEKNTGSVVFSGIAYPQSVVRILKDGQIAAITAGDDNGNFETTLSDLTAGSYTFSLYAYDHNIEKSKTLTFQKSIVKNEIQEITNIIVPPTLSANKKNVKQGEKISFSCQSATLSSVAFFLESGSGSFLRSTASNSKGFCSYELDTGSLDPGNYTVRAKTAVGGFSSAYSEEFSFEVFANPPPSAQTQILDGVDLTTWKCVPQTTVRKPVFSGTTNISEALVKIEIRNKKKKKRYVIAETRADENGYWFWKNSRRLKRNSYTFVVTLIDPDDSSRNFSYSEYFKIVKKIKKSTLKKCQTAPINTAESRQGKLLPLSQTDFSASTGKIKADFNGDARINLIDYSILINWLGRNDFPAVVDLNTDGKLDVNDLSILIYHWTG